MSAPAPLSVTEPTFLWPHSNHHIWNKPLLLSKKRQYFVFLFTNFSMQKCLRCLSLKEASMQCPSLWGGGFTGKAFINKNAENYILLILTQFLMF